MAGMRPDATLSSRRARAGLLRKAPENHRRMNPFALLAPLFLALEVWQLVLSERYMGIKQIKVNADPRTMPMANWMAAAWAGSLLVYGVWMFSLLLHPVGRAQGVVLLAI